MGYPRTGFKSYVRGFDVITATSVTTTGAVTVGSGLTISAGQVVAPVGSAANPTYVYAGALTSGHYFDSSRVAASYAGSDKAYWGSTNHNYVAVSVTGALNGNNIVKTTGTAKATVAVTSNHTATDNNDWILCDPTSGAITVTLPAAAANKQTYFIRKTVASANAVTIDGSGAETIDGAATLVVPNTTTYCIVSDGVAWHSFKGA